MSTVLYDSRLNEPIGRLAAHSPRYIRVFEAFGLDYCCSGHRTLEAACFIRQIDPQTVLGAMDEINVARESDEIDWTKRSLTELADHIEQVHHQYLKRELPRLHALVVKVSDHHGPQRPELVDLRLTFELLRDELQVHMMKEEQILFPAIRAMEASSQRVDFPFGTVANPIRMMEDDHQGAGEALRLMRNITRGFTAPPDACNTFRGTMESLRELEHDMHVHIHKEDNILFPRAQALENGLNAD